MVKRSFGTVFQMLLITPRRSWWAVSEHFSTLTHYAKTIVMSHFGTVFNTLTHYAKAIVMSRFGTFFQPLPITRMSHYQPSRTPSTNDQAVELPPQPNQRNIHTYIHTSLTITNGSCSIPLLLLSSDPMFAIPHNCWGNTSLNKAS